MFKILGDRKSKNFWPGRRGQNVRAVVIHKCEGNFSGCFTWCLNPKSLASYHYIIDLGGEIHQLVADEDSAWHAGRVVRPSWTGIKIETNPNLYTIGISLAGKAWTEHTFPQLLSLGWLIARITRKFKLKIDIDTIVFHYEISAEKSCPGLLLSKAEVIVAAKIFSFLQV